MNLIEAIKSGKSYRRKGWSDRAWRAGVPDPTASAYHTFAERLDDLLADDWEIQEPAVTITRTQFDEAYRQALIWSNFQESLSAKAVYLLRKNLGLED